jgi:hypothetical protein
MALIKEAKLSTHNRYSTFLDLLELNEVYAPEVSYENFNKKSIIIYVKVYDFMPKYSIILNNVSFYLLI